MSDPCASIVSKIKADEGDITNFQKDLQSGNKAALQQINRLRHDQQAAQSDLNACRLKLLEDEHAKVGGNSGVLGSRTSSATACDDGVGWFAIFEHGVIYWTASTGAHAVWGRFLTKWTKLKREKGPLGYPVTDKTPTKGGDYVNFQGGVILLKDGADEAFEVHGDICGRYRELNSENGFLGLPLTDETTPPDGVGRFNHFEGGSIYWKPNLGARDVYADIRDFWQEHHWETGKYGYPITSEGPIAAGKADRFVDFENGVVTWRSGEKGAEELVAIQTVSRADVASQIQTEVHKMIAGADSRLYITKEAVITAVGDYSLLLPQNFVRNRMYTVAVSFGITVSGTNDPDVDLTLSIELRHNAHTKKVEAIPHTWQAHISLDWPTNWGTTPQAVGNQLKPHIDPLMGVPIPLTDTPEGTLSVKVMKDGSVNAYFAIVL